MIPRTISVLTPRMIAVLVLLLAQTAAGAATPEDFNIERFQALQERGEPVLVEISADWCPVCAVQKNVLKELYSKDDIQRVHWLELDWDAQRQAARDLGAWRQSTLILFRGHEEIDRLVAQTDAGTIAELLDKAVEN